MVTATDEDFAAARLLLGTGESHPYLKDLVLDAHCECIIAPSGLDISDPRLNLSPSGRQFLMLRPYRHHRFVVASDGTYCRCGNPSRNRVHDTCTGR